ncbi:MAG TPA: DUF5047 domain-containing protein [Fibrella sp.]
MVKAEILENEVVLAELATDGNLCDGSVKCDRSAIQRTADVTLVDRDGTLTPRDIGDLLVPAGRQIRLWRGIMFNDRLPGGVADTEYVPLGTFRFTEVDVNYPEIRLSKCFDRGWIVSGEKLPFNVAINQNTNVVDTVIQLVQTAYPGVPMNLPITNENTNGMVFDVESDPWEACQTLFANLGLRLYFDPMGVLTARPEPSESDPQVWSYDDTDIGNLGLPQVGRTWTGDGYNGVTVVAENSDLTAPIRAAAYDMDPSSPTQWGSSYGKRMAPFIRDETIASSAQAQLRANKELQANLGLLQAITIPALVNPALEIGDVVRVAYNRTDAGDEPIIRESSNIVDNFEIPMRAKNTHTLGTRARRIIFNG